jgi:poly-gamma-glutamate capsule biosynthesis protein CapA/YwtB (metallophosphatase superfamily)
MGNPLQSRRCWCSDELIISAIKRVKDEVDTVVVSIHWGEEVVVDFPICCASKRTS